MSLTVVLNGQSRTFETLDSPAALDRIVAEIGLQADRVAVERNGEIAPRSTWAANEVNAGDKLEIVHFVGGGSEARVFRACRVKNGMRVCAWVCWIAVWMTGCWAAAMGQTVSEQYLLAAANQDRALHSLPPLRIDAQLTAAAAFHALQMATHHGISHQFAGEPELAERASIAGARFSLVTENVAEAPNSALIHDMWMKSAGHRANLLDPKVDSVGISVVSRDGQLYAVEDFARTVESLSLDQQEAAVEKLLADKGLALMSEATVKQDARSTCALSSGFSGTRKPWFVMRYSTANLKQLPDELTTRLTGGRDHHAAVGACKASTSSSFTSYSIAILLYP